MEQNRKAAAIGLMRSSFRAREWADAIADSRLVLDSFKADKDLQREARYVNAKSLMSTSRRAEALEQFKLLAKEPATDEGAEAAYILIQDRFDRADFAAVQRDFCLVVVVFAPHAVGEPITHQLIDAVFHHIADNQCNE